MELFALCTVFVKFMKNSLCLLHKKLVYYLSNSPIFARRGQICGFT